MVTLHLLPDTVVFELRGWHKVWALKGRLVVPRSRIRAARRDPAAARFPRGFRLGGTYLPGVIAAGRYWWRGEWEFWDVRRRENAVVIDLEGGPYDRLVLEFELPDLVVALLSPTRSPVQAA